MQEQPKRLDLYRRARAVATRASRGSGLPVTILAVGVKIPSGAFVMCQQTTPQRQLVKACAEIITTLESGQVVAVVRPT